MPRLAVFTNPRARQNRRNPQLAATLAARVGERGVFLSPESPEALASDVAMLREQGVEVVAVHGGDGTSHTVLTALARAWGDAPLPAVALLPGGTMNTVASGIGVRGSGPAVLDRLLRAMESQGELPHVTRHLLRVGPGEPQYGFLFGNGLISNYLEAYYEGADPTPTKALVVLARGILSSLVNGAFFRRLMRPVEVDVEVDGVRWGRRPYQAIGAGTVDDIGFRFRPFYLALTHPGSMHALGIACPPIAFVWQLPNIRLARATTHPDIASAPATTLTLRGDGPLAYMIDGDFHVGGEELAVSVGPAVRLVVPPT